MASSRDKDSTARDIQIIREQGQEGEKKCHDKFYSKVNKLLFPKKQTVGKLYPMKNINEKRLMALTLKYQRCITKTRTDVAFAEQCYYGNYIF